MNMRLLTLGALFALSSCSASGLWRRNYSPGDPQYHRVQSGDTLSGIADNYGVSVKQIALLNGIRNINAIRVGQELLLSHESTSREPIKTTSKGGNASYSRASLSNKTFTGGRLLWPLPTGRLVSRFGPRGRSFHDGIDIAAPTGTPVLAAHSGTVIYSGQGLRGYGKLLIVRSKDGLMTIYAHNSRILVRKGATVSMGDKIAAVGSTGRSSGPHLHFEIRMKNSGEKYVAVDPLPFFTKKTKIRPRFRVNEGLTAIFARAGL